MRRRAVRVMRPAREKKRWRRVLVVATCCPRVIRVVQRARLWANTWTASQAPFGKLRIGGEAARGEMIESHSVLEVTDGVLHLGVAVMVGVEIQGVARSIGDEAVVAVGVEEGQLRAGRGIYPAHDEAHRRGVGFTANGCIFSLRHVGGSLHQVRNGSPAIFWYGLDQLLEASVLADGDGEADTRSAADGDHVAVVETSVGPQRELTGGPGVAHSSHRLP